MKKIIFTLLPLFAFTIFSQAQDHTINLSGVAFSPNNLTVQAGETVEWVNLGGIHNVNGSLAKFPGNPEGFLSGNPASAPWTFQHTFTLPGTYDYVCDIHEGSGMTGTITVAAASDVIITEIMYNNPSNDDYEFIEFYNNGDDAVNLENWTISSAIDYTFPAYTLNPGEYVVVALNDGLFDAAFGIDALDWDEGNFNSLNNTGETIVLNDAAGNVVDSVAYSDSAPWPTEADGTGPSLVLCDFDSDNNDPANWAAALTPSGFVIGNTEVLANPGDDSGCVTGPVIGFLLNGFTLQENAGAVFVTVTLNNGNANQTQVTLELDPSSTATPAEDFVFSLPATVTFPAGAVNDTQFVIVNLVDDPDIENTEFLVLNLTNPTNGGNINPGASQFVLDILDDDTPLTEALVITGIFDTQPVSGGTWAKGFELQATQDIPDLSIFGAGSANNGGGSNGVEVALPAISVEGGDCIYVTNDSLLFIDFFGFSPTVESPAANINGDDAIELFENNIVIDVFGEINVDGTGTPWEYLDGWAYRQSGTGPDGNNFQLDNWNFSGVGALIDAMTNASALAPFPACTYTITPPTTAIANDDNVSTAFNTAVTINILGNDVLPNPLTTLTVISGPSNGSVIVNGLDDITYTPALDYCGPDVFTYEICDALDCDEATVNITVECPTSYPEYDIATITTVNAGGLPDSSGVTCQIQGIVYGIDLQGVNPSSGAPLDALQFFLIDNTGGVSVYSNESFGYTVQEGDEVIVRGTVDNFNCLTEFDADTLWMVSSGNTLAAPAVTPFIDESLEAEFVEVTNLRLVNPNDWLGNGGSFNVRVYNIFNPQDTFIMRIDNDSELSSMSDPIGALNFQAIGLGSQFDNQGTCNEGYQFLPRYATDIMVFDNAEEDFLNGKIRMFPNPAGDALFIESELVIEDIFISNALGQQLMQVNAPGKRIDVSRLQPGLYLATFRAGDASWTGRFVKE